jgi:hypothetical protein
MLSAFAALKDISKDQAFACSCGKVYYEQRNLKRHEKVCQTFKNNLEPAAEAGFADEVDSLGQSTTITPASSCISNKNSMPKQHGMIINHSRVSQHSDKKRVDKKLSKENEK